ncbi:MAG: hypothetical protein IKX36_00455 [Prevotella sp.]|nr:hypothetical protein [Prevotella sp.]
MRKIIPLLVFLSLLGACSSVDCPLNNTVYAVYSLSGDVLTLPDSLTISTKRHDGRDTVLLNKSVNTQNFKLQMSYSGDQDMYILSMTDTLHVTRTDTITVNKTNEPHFESVDCAPVYFHTLTGVSYTTHTISEVTISKPLVNYETTETNLYIVFKPRD